MSDKILKLFNKCQLERFIDLRVNFKTISYYNFDHNQVSWFWKVEKINGAIITINIRKTDYSNRQKLYNSKGIIIWNSDNRKIVTLIGSIKPYEVYQYFFSPCFKPGISLDEDMIQNYDLNKIRYLDCDCKEADFEIKHELIYEKDVLDLRVCYQKKSNGVIDIHLYIPSEEPLAHRNELNIRVSDSVITINQIAYYNYLALLVKDIDKIIKSLFLDEYKIILNCQPENFSRREVEIINQDIIKQNSLCPDVEKLILKYLYY